MNKFLLNREKFTTGLHLKQQGFQKVSETRNLKHSYTNELD